MDSERPRWRDVWNRLFPIGTLALLLCLGIAGFLGPGCREQSTAPIDRNQAPETVLTGVPGDSTTNFYWIRLYWAGYDVDGTVVGYEWAITDSLPPPDGVIYRYTTQTDSIFVFTVEESREILGHRFYCRAVDNEGKRDPSPAFAFFAVRNNCVPTAWFTRAEAFGPAGERRPLTSTSVDSPTDTIPSGWGVRFAWAGSDCDQALTPEGDTLTVGQVAAYEYKLGPIEINWKRVGTSDTTVTYEPNRLRSATFEMSVRARDDAGLTGTDPALRTFVWNLDPRTSFSKDLVAGHPDSVPVFYASTTGTSGEYLAYTNGDTLPLSAAGFTLRATVLAHDPDFPNRILGLEARLVEDAAFWEPVQQDGFFDVTLPNYTGNYVLQARSQDGLERWDGSPAQLRFFVNIPPRFLDEWDYYGREQTQRPFPDATYPTPDADTLRVRFAAHEVDFSPNTEYLYRFDRYPLSGGASGEETRFNSRSMIGEFVGGNFVIQGSQAYVTLQTQERFRPGQYVLRIQARDYFSNAQDRDLYGRRENERLVRFNLD